MWELEVTSDASQIYAALKAKFHEAYVDTVYDDIEIKDRRGRVSRLGNRTQTEPGVSEQFRRVQKSLQLMTEVLSGTVRVSCGGTPDEAIYLKVEAV